MGSIKFLKLFLGFVAIFSVIFEWGGGLLSLIYLISKENWVALITFAILLFASKGITSIITFPASSLKPPILGIFAINIIVAIYNIFLFYLALDLIDPRLFLGKLICGIVAFIAGTSGFFEILQTFLSNDNEAYKFWPIVFAFNFILPILYILFAAKILTFMPVAIFFIIAVFIATIKLKNA